MTNASMPIVNCRDEQITVIEALIGKCDVILLGGGMIFTFFKAKGLGVGKSLVSV